MKVVRVRNVTEAWARLPEALADAERQPSRNGDVLVCPEPVTTVYERPRERVLRDPHRDANPFFHLVEALWMLAGRNDVGSLTPYVKNFGQYAESDGTVHGAYGHRWRRMHASVDQLDTIVHKLSVNPSDRQAVLQMWDMTFNCDLDGSYADRPCNTHVYFRVRRERRIRGGDLCVDHLLDMTVCCRSNDMVFGGYGANAVHFSVLQEYMASRLRVEVGRYYQVSNNFHVYEKVWEKYQDRQYWSGLLAPIECAPMFDVPDEIDEDLERFFDWHEHVVAGHGYGDELVFSNMWFHRTALPLVRAHALFRAGDRGAAVQEAGKIECPAWYAACTEWLARRLKR